MTVVAMKNSRPAAEEQRWSHSVSRFRTYRQCPLSYKKRYIDKVPEPQSDPLLIGAAVHEIIENYQKYLLQQKLQSDITAMPKLIDEFFSATPHQHIRDEVEMLIEKFLNFHVFNPVGVVGIEAEYAWDAYTWEAAEWFGKERSLFRAKLDMIHMLDADTIEIEDYKTSHNKEDDPEQLRTYAWAVKKMFPGIRKIQVANVYIRLGFKDEPVVISDKEIAAIDKSIKDMIGLIESEKKWKPSHGSHCFFCASASDCPIGKKLGESLCRTKDEAENIAAEITVLEAALKAKKEVLKGFCGTNGNVLSGDLEYGFIRTTSRSVDPKEFIKHMESNGTDPWKFITVSGTKFKKWDSLPAGMVSEKIGTTFKSKKAGGDEDD